MRYNSRRRWVYKFRRSYMYKFSLTDERTLIAVNEDDGETVTIADEICWFKEYDNLVIALSVNKKFSALYKICKTSLVKELALRIQRNINESKEGIFPILTYDKVIAIELKEPYLVCVVRKNCRSLGFTETQKDCLIVTNIETKETKVIYEWNVMGEAGCVGIGIPHCYEKPDITLEDEWINVKTTFKKPTRDYWFTNGAIGVKNFRIRYDGNDKEEIR